MDSKTAGDHDETGTDGDERSGVHDALAASWRAALIATYDDPAQHGTSVELKWNWRLGHRFHVADRSLLMGGESALVALVPMLNDADDRVVGAVARRLIVFGHGDVALAAAGERLAETPKAIADLAAYARRSDLLEIRERMLRPVPDMARGEDQGFAYERRPAETLAEVRRRFAAAGWPEGARQIERSLQPCLRLWSELCPQETVPFGASRFGGLPDLPPSFVWPSCDGFPLGFIVQLDCSMFPEAIVEAGFPATGQLIFFREYAGEAWGSDKNESGNWLLTHADVRVDELVRTPFPDDLDPEGRFHPAAIDLDESLSLPDSEDPRALPFDVVSRFFAVTDSYDDIDPSTGYDQLGGYAGSIQQPVAYAVPGESEPWQLVLEIGSSACGWVWGSFGEIYVLMRPEDLLARRFERAWVILQCT